jgi:hypothetical protein
VRTVGLLPLILGDVLGLEVGEDMVEVSGVTDQRSFRSRENGAVMV